MQFITHENLLSSIWRIMTQAFVSRKNLWWSLNRCCFCERGQRNLWADEPDAGRNASGWHISKIIENIWMIPRSIWRWWSWIRKEKRIQLFGGLLESVWLASVYFFRRKSRSREKNMEIVTMWKCKNTMNSNQKPPRAIEKLDMMSTKY